MGFFSDLKEDLNQAVNELMPGEKEEGSDKQKAQQTDAAAMEAVQMDDEETLKQLAELEEILQKIDLPTSEQPNEFNAFAESGEAQDADSMSFEELGDQSFDLSIEEAVETAEKTVEETAEKAAEVTKEEVVAAVEDNVVAQVEPTELPEEPEQQPVAPEIEIKAEEPAAEEQTADSEDATSAVNEMPTSLSEADTQPAEPAEDDLQTTVGELQDAVAALKESVEEQKAKEEAAVEVEEPGTESLEDELRATFGAQEGEETVEDYLHEEAIRTGAEIIDKSWVLDLKGMETMDETAIITAGMRVKGDILSNGSADISGEVIGNVQIKGKLNITGRINGNSKAMEIFADSARVQGDMISDNSVKIGVDSVVIGNIEATSAVIAGAVKGTIDVKGPVILDATAVVLGNVRAKTMQINNGARIEGMCVLCYAEQSAAKFFEEQAGF